MSASGDIIRRLLDSGMSGQAIGEAIGRDRSLVSQVGRGLKPGANLEAALRALEGRQGGAAGPVPAPPRRLRRSGRPANVRRPTTVRGRSYATSTIKRQAAAGGGRQLMHAIHDAADDGRQVAATVSFDKAVTVNNTSGGRRGRTGKGGSVEMRIDMPADELADTITYEYGGSVTAYLVAEAIARGYVSGPPAADMAGHVTAVELRQY